MITTAALFPGFPRAHFAYHSEHPLSHSAVIGLVHFHHSASHPQLTSLDLAAIAAPLLCSSWSGPGTEVLYEHITLYTGVQCILLHCTLQDAPSLHPLIRFLCLPSPREAPVVAPPTVVSADIMAACMHVQEIHVLQEASDIPFQTNYRN